MKNIIDEYGRNAGKIWETLNTNGSLPQTKLIRNTKLKNEEFHSAVGWLARENKINKQNMIQNPTYSLGETNLTTKIGEDAGKVWKTLSTLGENDVSAIAKNAQIEPDEVHAALGWLAREDKIDIKLGKNQKIIFTLKNDGSILKGK
jgi:Winged helix-turn-helix domain (DUF2582)